MTKTSETILKKYGPDYYKNIGKQSWKRERSHKTGFALMDPEKHKQVSSNGGKKEKIRKDTPNGESPEAGK